MNQNLLSKEKKQELSLGYKRRKIIVFSWSVLFAIVISIVVLLPNIFLIQSKLSSLSEEESMNALMISEQDEILNKPTELNRTALAVLSFKSKFQVSDKISKIKESVPSSIVLDAVSISSKPDKNQSINMLVSGVAKDRNSLISFEKTLKGLDFVKSTSVPVSSFTKDFDLPFTVTVSLKTQE